MRRVDLRWIAWENLHGEVGARVVRGGGLRFNSSSNSAKATSLFHDVSFSTVITRSSGTESAPAHTSYVHVQQPLPATRSPPPPQADPTNKVAKNPNPQTEGSVPQSRRVTHRQTGRTGSRATSSLYPSAETSAHRNPPYRKGTRQRNSAYKGILARSSSRTLRTAFLVNRRGFGGKIGPQLYSLAGFILANKS